MSLVVGLTGGIASGKSYVHRLFEGLGVPVLEADDVGRDVVAPGPPALAEIARVFGAEMLRADGSLDRAAMRARQLTRAERLACADDLILNGDPPRDLRPDVQRLHSLYGTLASARR